MFYTNIFRCTIILRFEGREGANIDSGGELSKMSQIIAKMGDVRRKIFSALEDVPDTLLGMIVFLTVLTVIALGILMFLGYRATNLGR
jgi:hypothetical protein